MVTPIKNLLADFLNKKKRQDKDVKIKLGHAVDSKLKKHIRGLKIDKKSIIIFCDTQAAAFNIKLREQDILSQARKNFPGLERVILKTKS